MTANEMRIIDQLVEELHGSDTLSCITRLMELGLLNATACERLSLRRAVEALHRQGVGRCDAFYEVAREYHCSYEKVRGAYYQSKNQERS